MLYQIEFHVRFSSVILSIAFLALVCIDLIFK